MAAPSLTYTVETDDAAPGVAPYKISDKPGKDTARVRVFPVAESGFWGYFSLRVEGTDPMTGIVVHEEGVLCGVTPCGVTASQHRVAPNDFLNAEIDYAEVALPDGDYPVSIWLRHDEAGWV